MNRLILMCGLMFLSIATWAQTRAVTGTIKGNQVDSILIGATIAEKGKPNVVESDESGNFSITVSDTGKVVLIVNYASGGYKTKEIEVGSQSNVTVQMEDDVQQMEEVVIVGYGTVKKSSLTGSVISLKTDDVKQVPTGNVMDGIQGKAAGVDIATTSGETGKSPNVTIRGNRSISAGNEPLYIVDGVQYGSIQDINQEDIQSMEVLKDASSTAIYGSRGANGVVIITTKKGSSGQVKVSLNTYTGVSNAAAFPRAMNGKEYLEFRRERYAALNNVNSSDVTDVQAIGNQYNDLYKSGNDYNYLDKILKQGIQKDIQFNMSGGSDKVKSYFSFDYFNQQGLLKNDNLNRYTGRLNLDYQINKIIKIGTQTQATYYDQNKRVNPISSAVNIVPYFAPYEKSKSGGDSLAQLPGSSNGGKFANPLLDEQGNGVDRIKTLRFFPTVFVDLTPIKGLNLRTNLALTLENSNEGTYYNSDSYTIRDGKTVPNATLENTNKKQVNWQGIISYNKDLIKGLSLNAVLLSEILTNTREYSQIAGFGTFAKEQLYYNLGGSNSTIVQSLYSQKSLVSFAGRVNLSYKDKYLLTATAREDGASVLADGNKWDIFPSIAGAWNIANEKFMESQKIFNTVKLRVSWGVSGNANLPAYKTQSLLTKVQGTVGQDGSVIYMLSPTIGNKNTMWEKTRTVDYGLDLGIMKDRITLSMDYYRAITSDLLLLQTLPATTGVTNTLSNIGSTSNNGFELSLSSVNIHKKDFKWTTTASFMTNKEKITALTGSDKMTVIPFDADGNNQASKTVVVGHPVNSFYDFEKIGIWQTEDSAEAKKYGKVPGQVRIKDQNNDGKIDASDQLVIGSRVPKFSIGFNTEFKYKNFDLSLYFFARVGQTFLYGYTYNPNSTDANNLATREYWTPTNHSNDLPRPGLPATATNDLTPSNYMDGSFLKLRSMTLGYNLPKKFLARIKVSKVRLYATGKNLLIFNKIKNYDTEMEGSLAFPTTRLYVFGMNIDF